MNFVDPLQANLNLLLNTVTSVPQGRIRDFVGFRGIIPQCSLVYYPFLFL